MTELIGLLTLLNNGYSANYFVCLFVSVECCITACVHCHQAKDMVGMVNKFAAKVEEKKGSLSEDEVQCIHVDMCFPQPPDLQCSHSSEGVE